MEDAIEIIMNRLNQLHDEFAEIQQQNTLKILKNEYDFLVLKDMTFKYLAEHQGYSFDELSSKFESWSHVARLGGVEAMKAALPNLDESYIKQHLGLED